MNVEAALGRIEHPAKVDASRVAGPVLITGAAGAIGRRLVGWLEDAKVPFLATDILHGWRPYDVLGMAPSMSFAPRTIFHLAANKHAPAGELDPIDTADVNIAGTANVVDCFPEARIVLASTCKAADPETVYGASKLIAERIVLNAGGSVARLYNVVDSDANVFRFWESLPPRAPIPVTACSRFLISLDEAVSTLIAAAVLEPGRYAIDPGPAQSMRHVVRRLYPDRELLRVELRRGDRRHEPRLALSEWFTRTSVARLVRIYSAHDLQQTPIEELAA